MTALIARVRRRLTFANLTSGLALFVALGGTSYAAISVGSAEIRTDAVGKSEIRGNAVGSAEIRSSAVHKSEVATNAIGRSEISRDGVASSEIGKDAVSTDEIKDGGIELTDLSAASRASLALPRVAVTKAGGNAGGNAKAISHTGPGVYTVEFTRDVSACTYGATLASVKNGSGVDTPTEGYVAVAGGDTTTKVTVKTFTHDDAATTPTAPADQPFHLIVAC
jgi:hypothetical protein